MANLGELERAVMDRLWAASGPLSVREVHARLTEERELAYTTVMTVLDRLAKKQVVLRDRSGRAWWYRPSQSRESMAADLMHTALGERELDRSAALLAFVDRVTPAEMTLLRQALADVPGPPAPPGSGRG